MNDERSEFGAGRLEWIGRLVGGLAFVLILLAPAPPTMPPVAWRLTAVTVLMAVWWVTQAIPIAATSLIPLVAFPLLGIQTAAEVSGSYMNQNIMLFLGGFLIALGIEKWGLHRRIALHIVRVLGGGPKRVLLGFMLATAFLSMWISNTASTLLMLPIGLAMLASFAELIGVGPRDPDDIRPRDLPPEAAQFATVLMLGIAYAASVGGFTTLVGTPTNIAFQQIWIAQFPEAPELSAGEWMLAFLPLGIVMLACAWLVLSWRLPPVPGLERFDRGFLTERLRELGRPGRAELLMLAVFAMTAVLWVFRKPLRIGTEPILPGWGSAAEAMLRSLGAGPEFAETAVHDSTVAVGMALLLFLIPAQRQEGGRTRCLMDWETAEKGLPWGILILIGGGFALANAFRETGLSAWTGERFADVVADWPVVLLVAAACLMMTLLTEFTSNVATVSAILPILAGTATSIGVDPRLIMIPAAITTSCAFMLPIATPPNAIVFGSGRVTVGQMVRYGVLLNLLGIVLVTLTAFVILVPQLGISPGELPEWVATGNP